MTTHHPPGLRSVHRALADPLRIRVLECLWERPHSAKELAAWAGIAPDRLYYHLAQLEAARLIEIAEYRRLPGGKVERVYRPTSLEPPGDEATPHESAAFLGAMLEATQADMTAAGLAKEAGARREITLLRTTVRVSEAALATLRDHLLSLVRQAQEPQDQPPAPDETEGAGVWTRVVVTLVDLQDRGHAPNPGDSASSRSRSGSGSGEGYGPLHPSENQTDPDR